MMGAKNIFLTTEGDAWYRRNREKLEEESGFSAVDLMIDFLNRQKKSLGGGVNGFSWDKLNILEIGCSYGYNLAKFCESFSCQCYGIEPSKEAVEDGNRRYKDLPIQLTQGTGDLLPYEAESMDVVIMGFCMLWMERKDILQAYAQADRVLKTNGIMMVYDFDAKMPYLRDNIHNREVFTYKMDYAQPFMAFPNYYLMDKTVFCHMGNFFDKRIQERISLQILYKESLEDAYRKG